jgi:hypothetical protein
MRCLPLLLVFTQVLISSQAQTQKQKPGDATEPAPYTSVEAYEVYSTILGTAFPSQSTQLVILGETVTHHFTCPIPDEQSKNIVGPAVDDYVAVNRQRRLLRPNLNLPRPYILISGAELSSLINFVTWEKFYSKYPQSGGYINLSAVGFNQSKTVAVLSWSLVSGSLGGHGEFRFLKKVDGKWVPLTFRGSACNWMY